MGLKDSGLRGSLRSVSTGVPAIPDSEVYLHDDWGDNRLTDREDSGTTTYNGVEGVYRPEWTIARGDPQAVNEELDLDGDDVVTTELSVALSEGITVELSNFDGTGSRDGGTAQYGCSFISETNSIKASNRFELQRSYSIRDFGADNLALTRNDDSDRSVLIDIGSYSAPADITVTRTSNGEFEVFVDGVSQGTATDTTYSEISHCGFGARDDDIDFQVNEFKIS